MNKATGLTVGLLSAVNTALTGGQDSTHNVPDQVAAVQVSERQAASEKAASTPPQEQTTSQPK